MLVLISDSNVLIDIEVGNLLPQFFSLGYRYVVPDILYVEELEQYHPHLLGMGLQIMTLGSQGVARVEDLSQIYSKPGRNDLFALALAEAEQCPLLTGDANLRIAAEELQITVRGTVWALSEMVKQGQLTVSGAHSALQIMKANGRRLPWAEAEQTLNNLGV